ncbi:uncharacterized protein LOC124165474 [Ischnura elegans]|uniref:uncharacterized protein LOC124165474 n=1 Tax=Ischnura elegans TaxID=197161 RepID=UPI001ED892CF|nr:uncharacterized protein LOC124165474 [Ischnura elegans]
MEGTNDDFGFVQRSAAVLQMAEKGDGGSEGGEGGSVGDEDEGLGREEEMQNGGSGQHERKSSKRPEGAQHADGGASAPATGDTGAARGSGSDSGSVGSTRGKTVARLLRSMSGPKAGKDANMKTLSPDVDPTLNQLPQSFLVKYLGKRDAPGLWGIKHTRRPVDAMVKAAKGGDGHPPLVLPLVKLTVSGSGVTLTAANPAGGDKKKKQADAMVFHPIETISYGVQDLVYTRVFSMIIVRESLQVIGGGKNSPHPFQCHGFVCDSRNSARRLTYVLAAAFQEFSRQLKMEEAQEPDGQGKKKKSFKKFAIDLRTPEQIEEDLKQPDSEA